MLEDLDRIDWAHLRHSHGMATEFPTWIRQLRSDDAATRQEAQETLFEYSNHQGSIYEVTPYLVPFLIELAAAKDTPDRAALLYHLGNIGRCCNWTVARSIYGGDEHETYERIKGGLELYLALLDDSDSEVRLAAFFAATAVTLFVNIWNVLEQLMTALEREGDPAARVEMIGWLGEYTRGKIRRDTPAGHAISGQKLVAFLCRLTRPEEDRRVRLAAALTYLTLWGDWTREAAAFRPLFRDVLAQPEAYAGSDDGLACLIMLEKVIEGLMFEPRAGRLEDLAAGLRAARYPEDAHLIARALLDTLFWGVVRADDASYGPPRTELRLERRLLADGDLAERPDNRAITFRHYPWQTQEEARRQGWFYLSDPPPVDPGTLSAGERDMLRLVLETPLVWMVHSNLLAAYGLPVNRAETLRLLAESEPGPSLS